MATIEIWTQQPEPEPAATNDAHAELAALYGELRPRLLNRVRFKWRIRGELAEDLVHDAWVRAIEHYDRFDRDRPFEPWALRILDNVVIDHLRRHHTVDGRARQLSVEIDDLRLEITDGPTPEVDRVGDRDMLSRAMATLPPRQQATAVRVLVDGLSLDETADSMELSNTACRQLLHRARVGLRRALLDQGMLPGLAPVWWLRDRLMAFARRVGAVETSAVAGSTATVVALAVTVTMVVGAGDAIARARDGLDGTATASSDQIVRPSELLEKRLHAPGARGETGARSRSAKTGAVRRPESSRNTAAAPATSPSPAWKVVPATRIPMTRAAVDQNDAENPDYDYGVGAEVPGPAGAGVTVGMTAEYDDEESAGEARAVDEALCNGAAATPAGYCSKDTAP